jgi:MerR family transcriptional regulator, light-induced transcriptional regulator
MAGLRERMFAGAWRKPNERRWSAAVAFRGMRTARPKREELPHDAPLRRTIEADVIPRLVLAHSVAPRRQDVLPAHRGTPDSDRIARFAELILTPDQDAVQAYIEALRAHGARLETIYLDLVVPTASYLRYLWNADLYDFAEITLALWRLQQVVRGFGAAFRSEGNRRETGLRALLVPGPNAKHELPYLMFGLVMVGEFLRRDGWDTWIEPDPSSRDFAEIIRSQWFDVVEFLVSSNNRLDLLVSNIRLVRRQSPNPAVGVILSGQVFIENPELALLVGGDITATDACQGAAQAQKLVSLLSAQT